MECWLNRKYGLATVIVQGTTFLALDRSHVRTLLVYLPAIRHPTEGTFDYTVPLVQTSTVELVRGRSGNPMNGIRHAECDIDGSHCPHIIAPSGH